MNNKIIKINDINLSEKEEEIYDINKFGITKINNKINNNQFNIILLDKKSENKNYSKKPSFLNLSNTEFNHENIGFKETKSENKDESCEKLHNKMNGLFNKDALLKKGKGEKIKNINNNSLFLKKSNKLININDMKINNNYSNNNHQNKFEDNNLNDNTIFMFSLRNNFF